jgi:hypothetical protein
MRVFAAIIGFYIFSLAFGPAIGYLYSSMNSKCVSTCSSTPVEKKDSGCSDKQKCCYYFCCFKTPVFPPLHYKKANFFQPEVQVKNNFATNKFILPLTSFEIWHPPKFV